MLTVIGIDPDKKGRTYWVCQCDCGNVKSVRSDSLQDGMIRSCGCLKRQQDKINLTANHTHKMSSTRIYSVWANIKHRCNNPHDTRYYRYGGRGIKMCEEWEKSFVSFFKWAMANGYKDDLSIDRIDNDKGYFPENCRWSTAKEQSNNRSTNVKIKIGNAVKTVTEWCEIFELDLNTVLARYSRSGYISVDQLFNGESQMSQDEMKNSWFF